MGRDTLRNLLEEFYKQAWNHGFDNQVLLSPDVLFDKWEERIKKLDK